jgi:hypothetical protein
LSLAPEILFHRFFTSDRLSKKDKAVYRGKLDLNGLDSVTKEHLLLVQQMFGASLPGRTIFPDGRERQFHFDYVDSDKPNALAFEYCDHSFIGVTKSLIDLIWHACIHLSRSTTIAQTLRTSPEEAQQDATLLAPVYDPDELCHRP